MWRTNQTQTALRDLHSGGVYGLDALEQEVRQAGFAGCLGDFDLISGVPNPDTAPRSVVWGEKEDGMDTRYNVAGDRFRIRYLETIWNDPGMRREWQATGGGGTVLEVTARHRDSPDLNNNDAIALVNCERAAYAELVVTGGEDLSRTAETININTSIDGPSYFLTAPPTITNIYRHWYIEYYVHEDSDGLLSLRRDDLGLNVSGGAIVAQPIIRDIKRMTVLYGEDTSGNSAPDVYETADEVTNWNNIRAIRITLDLLDADLCGDNPNTPASQSCQAQTTILLRNRL